MRKVFVNVIVRLIITADESEDINDILSEMDYHFSASESHGAEIVDSEITEWEITDSK